MIHSCVLVFLTLLASSYATPTCVATTNSSVQGVIGEIYCINGGVAVLVSEETGECACNNCDPGFTGANCATNTICGEDEYVSANVCTTCPSNTTAVAGADASGPNTICEGDAVSSTVFTIAITNSTGDLDDQFSTEIADLINDLFAAEGIQSVATVEVVGDTVTVTLSTMDIESDSDSMSDALAYIEGDFASDLGGELADSGFTIGDVAVEDSGTTNGNDIDDDDAGGLSTGVIVIIVVLSCIVVFAIAYRVMCTGDDEEDGPAKVGLTSR